jgi:hypothetical protein
MRRKSDGTPVGWWLGESGKPWEFASKYDAEARRLWCAELGRGGSGKCNHQVVEYTPDMDAMIEAAKVDEPLRVGRDGHLATIMFPGEVTMADIHGKRRAEVLYGHGR